MNVAKGLSIILLCCPWALPGQDAQLRQAFEGKNVVVKIDMPGTKDGIDIFPNRADPLDFSTYQQRLKRYGVAVRQGDTIMVTKVLIKDKVIEFQLGGGGYGTFSDDTSTSTSYTDPGPSRRERDLQDQIKNASGDSRRAMERDLDRLRRDRERDNARLRAEAAQAQELARARIDQKRREGGSRFNIRYEPRVPSTAMTPESVMTALEKWIEFGARSEVSAAAAASLPLLRKGMSRAEVDAILGPPIDVTEGNEGTLRVSTAVYDVSGVTGKVTFANGVVVRFLYQSR